IARAETMLADGASVAEIERTLGRRPGALTRRFAGRGWSHAECGKYAMMVRYARAAKYELEIVV
ncbi:MAG: hypothetical protein JWP32_2700, partial [Schumannella sp.]|nr:hypothetical protein [Schumannella sp.]